MIQRKMVRFIKRSFSTSFAWWENVGLANKDPIFGITEAFQADTSPNKMNLGLGSYRDGEGKQVVLQCVREAEERLKGTEFLEYLPMDGNLKLIEESVKLVYGEDSDVIAEKRYAGVQDLSGTGACRLFAEFQRHFHPESRIYLPVPTWSNHHHIWRAAQVPQRTFNYYNYKCKDLDFPALIDDIKNAPNRSFFLLHPCAHNPTGVDPSVEQWKEISYQFKVKCHFPFFDMAYQGFASGDLIKDAQAIRIFLDDDHLIGCAQSFAKTMGLYGHRVGCLSILCANEKQAIAVRSQLKQIARSMYSSPPVHGALLVSTVLSDPLLKGLWVKEVKEMFDRIRHARVTLRENLEKMGSLLDWEHITKQVGVFCFTGLTPEQVDRLSSEYHIYMTQDGRISLPGVTTSNASYLAKAIHDVTKSS